MLASVIASSRRRLDPLTVAYAAASGATSLAGIDAIMRYARAESLLNNIRLYPMKSAQNAGTGTTVYGIGSLTANNMTLVNGPTWGAGGLAFVSASSQYGSIDDFLGSDTLTVFARVDKTNDGTNTTAVAGQLNAGSNLRSWGFYQAGARANDPIVLARSANGTSVNAEFYETGVPAGLGVDSTHVCQWVHGGGRTYWVNKAAQSITRYFGTDQTSRFDTSDVITFSALKDGAGFGSFANQTAIAFATITGTLTTTQRETLTDLINAL
jgi:hypothetical protein